MLTEREIAHSWRTLLKNATFNEEAFSRAEELLEGLRPESPLRHRLSVELEELRQRADQEA